MERSLTDILCTRCGLCCGGALFADVELARHDNSADLEALGLEIEDDDDRPGGEVLIQPCAALRGKRCTIYPYRPKCCRTFECRVLRSVRLGVMAIGDAQKQIADALERIRNLHKLIKELGTAEENLSLSDRCHEILGRCEEATDSVTLSLRSRLETELKSLTHQLQKTFLGP